MMHYTKIPDSILNLKIAPADIGILIQFCRAYDINRRKLWYSQEKLSTICNLSERQIKRYVQKFAKAGLLTKLVIGCNQTGSSEYDIPLYRAFLDQTKQDQVSTSSTDSQIRAQNAPQAPTVETPTPQQQTQPKASKGAKNDFLKPTPEIQAAYDAWVEYFPESGLQLRCATIRKFQEIQGKLAGARLGNFVSWFYVQCHNKGLVPRTPSYVSDDHIAQYVGSESWKQGFVFDRIRKSVRDAKAAGNTELVEELVNVLRQYNSEAISFEEFETQANELCA